MSDVGADLALETVVRAESGRLVGLLHRSLGDLDVAEEAVADAVAEALTAWRRDGIPDRPAAWLHTAARRNALDRLRRDAPLRGRPAAPGEGGAGGGAPACGGGGRGGGGRAPRRPSPWTASCPGTTNGWRCCSAAATRRW